MPRLRALDPTEADTLWSSEHHTIDYSEYIADIKSMKPGVTYEADPDQGVSPLSARHRYDLAAKQIGKPLRWLRHRNKSGDKRLIFKLQPQEPSRNGSSRPEHVPQALVAKAF
jgi:hypothetical protein